MKIFGKIALNKYQYVGEKYFRPVEIEFLLGDSTKDEKELGWKRKVSFQDLVSGMDTCDL